MFAKLFQKHSPRPPSQRGMQESPVSSIVAPLVAVHYGIPSTASVLAFDPIQKLLAIGTLDGRIKVVGGDNIEGLLMSPKSIPFKNLEFFHNQGFLVSVSTENEIQIWDLENRRISSSLQWESNITAFSVIYGTHFMYIGDEYGFLSALKYDAEAGELVQLIYHIPANLVAEAANLPFPFNQSIVGVLPQPSSCGDRVLIAYENGLIVLWDLTEDKAVIVRGNKDLQLKDDTVVKSSNDGSTEPLNDILDQEYAEKEISSLCWVSAEGSFLAVGYVDGDIFLWNLSVSDNSKGHASQKSSDNVVKIQLSSADRRLPVIVLHWSPNKVKNGLGGQLFVYGGEEIGSDEVLTVLDLDWSSGIAMLKCVHRIDLPLHGSFSDMTLIASTGEVERNNGLSLLVLTNPGQLHFYDYSCLSTLKSEPEKKHSDVAVEYPAVVPIIEPRLTVGNLYSVYSNYSRILAKAVEAGKLKVQQTMSSSKSWPVSGGVPGQMLSAEEHGIQRIYVAGYQDGTVRIWDATYPALSILFVLGLQVEGIEVAGANAAISALDFSSTLSLAVGNEYGLVSLYGLDGTHGRTSFCSVTQTEQKVLDLPHHIGSQIRAVYALLNSPVRSLQWVKPGNKLAVGFECGQAALLETSSLSVLFVTDNIFSSSSSIISLAVGTVPNIENISVQQSENRTSEESSKEVIFALTRDANIVLVDTSTGKKMSEPIQGDATVAEGAEERISSSSQHLEERSQAELGDHENQTDPLEDKNSKASLATKIEDSVILLCFENALHLYSTKSLIQGKFSSIFELNLVQPCSWTTIFRKNGKEYGLIIVYKSGEIEIRLILYFLQIKLCVLGSTSLTKMLRWNFKANMVSLMSSSDKGQITLVNGSEFAIVSLLAFENDFRTPEFFPCLHDKVLAAAADATIGIPQFQKNKQTTAAGVFGGIVKGLKGSKVEIDDSEVRENVVAHLDTIFSRLPFSGTLENYGDDELGLDINIDDIEIDEPLLVEPLPTVNNEKREKGTERERLFEGSSSDTKPKLRTREEIIAKYRKAGDATSAATQARDKLVERQQKLEKLSERTAELQNGAENFASMAQELARTMERRKWWNF
ncbi:OLC1v1026834C2 [Oldenlandia corymbosa var. corymbosa]|uniref:OLC1v1026834C2 n=1 Tax=Oldenlandia corymbosa var. corymbosa TaxID=529605 RepID=A0AAV1C8Q2_OLDCO|nr:OLC1v1026834C2 [Oldenlandia corymbosa var. corymbosa]